jgi:uncharacterized protein (DUF697 family)
MVSAINSTNIVVNNSKQEKVKTLVKYINNETLKETKDTFKSTTKSAIPTTAVFQGIPLLNLLKRGKFIGKVENSTIQVNDALKNISSSTQSAFKNIFTGTDGNVLSRLKNYFSVANQSQKEYSELQSSVKSIYKAAKKGVTKTVENETSQAVIKETTANTLVEVAENSTKLGKFGKFLKSSGASTMLIFSGIIEAATEVIPTFKELGVEKGLKQTGKSAIKVIGDTTGFIAGEQIGVALGSAIGTALFPVVGTAIGGACGLVGGLLGSFALGKVTKAITGKTEREIAKEQEQELNAQNISTDSEQLEELKQEVYAKVQNEANQGEISDDGKIALETLQNLDDTEAIKDVEVVDNYEELNNYKELENLNATNPFAA